MPIVKNNTIRLIAALALSAPSLWADNLLHPGVPAFDRPTLTTVGVQFPVTGDDNFNASVTVRYRVSGTSAWSTALPLFRVHPETVANYTVAPQFAGSIFDLKPATSYDIELHAIDPDGLDQIFNLTGATRALPSNPASPTIVNVSSAATFQSALSSASPGTIILLANGVYPGTFGIGVGGTASNPIVIRGASEDGVIIDGGNCVGCNVIEVYGAGYVHIESLTIQNAERAIRFQSTGATGNVVRRIHVKNTALGIGGKGTQYDFYIADNILEGQLLWPHVYSDDNGLYSDNDGIAMSGFGHVVAHNQISGYGDAMKTTLQGARAVEFYGNDVLFTYDNAVELDGSEGNSRAFRNRFTNTYMPLSVQPIHGGPAYLFRNVVVNIANEQLKFHAEGSPYQEPSGILVYHNTFVSPQGPELQMETTVTSHYFAIENNLFIAPPAAAPGPIAVDWLGVNDHGIFDYNGYFPNGSFRFHNPSPAGYLDEPNFSALLGTGYETHGLLAAGLVFANGMTGPSSYTLQVAPPNATIAPGSVVQDKGLILPNINDNFTGAGPDLGALEIGCPNPMYGPRPVGVDESNEVLGCVPAASVTAVAVAPSSMTLAANAMQQFSAATSPVGGAVSWQIAPARGTIGSTGLYTAPADAMQGETVRVTATSTSNPLASGTALVTLTAPVTISVAPVTWRLGQGVQKQFVAQVAGAVNKAVTWSMQPALGTLTSGGLYTAPVLVTTPQKVIVTATSAANSTKTATAVVNLEPAISPDSVTIHSGAAQQFYASVPGATGAYQWSISPATGSVSATGLYQAPSLVNAPVTITITATSVSNPALRGQTMFTVAP